MPLIQTMVDYKPASPIVVVLHHLHQVVVEVVVPGITFTIAVRTIDLCLLVAPALYTAY